MYATYRGGAAASAAPIVDRETIKTCPRGTTARLAAYLDGRAFEHPTLVMDLERVAEQHRALASGLGDAHIHYAVKANPHPEIIALLHRQGAKFDAASRGEIELCLAAGARPADISFGNTVKRARDIAWAHRAGVDLFAADAEEEIAKIATHAPGARVFIRLLVEQTEADWPLSRKFGATPGNALRLMGLARGLGLRPVGISFHIGSQTRQARMWTPVLDETARVWRAALSAGFEMEVLNIGGGFPAFYGEPIETPEGYAREVMALVHARFGKPAYVMAEPGRGLVADAGVIAAEVLLVSRKRPSDAARWVYLDIGKFSGLAETIDEAIRYQIETAADGGETGPCILAGPSCDSADVLYETTPMRLPLGLAAGDPVWILAAGAYTGSYASVGFNGFPPLDTVCI
ncbi:MAG: type III PLP-dependent enzyme [Pseudomonadota bacterium]